MWLKSEDDSSAPQASQGSQEDRMVTFWTDGSDRDRKDRKS